MQVRRGDIVGVELNPTKGSEQKGDFRPCLVIQNDTGNKYSPTTIVAPLTTEYDPDDTYPFEVEVLSKKEGVIHDSVIDLSQIRVIDIEARIMAAELATLSSEKMAEVDMAIKKSLGLS